MTDRTQLGPREPVQQLELAGPARHSHQSAVTTGWDIKKVGCNFQSRRRANGAEGGIGPGRIEDGKPWEPLLE